MAAATPTTTAAEGIQQPTKQELEEWDKSLLETENAFRSDSLQVKIPQFMERAEEVLLSNDPLPPVLPPSVMFFLTRAIPRLNEVLLKRGEVSAIAMDAAMEFMSFVSSVAARYAYYDIPEMWKALYDTFDGRRPLIDKNNRTMAAVQATIVKNVNAFYAAKGFDAIVSRFSLKEKKVPLEIMRLTLRPIAKVREMLKGEQVISFTNALAPVVSEALAAATMEEFKAEKKDSIIETLRSFSTILKGVSPKLEEMADRTTLVVADKLFSLPVLEKKFAGLKEILEYLALAPASGKPIRAGWMTPSFMADWMRDNKFVERLLVPSSHIELLKKSGEVLRYLASQKCLKIDHLETLWGLTIAAHESVQSTVFLVLGDLANYVDHPEWEFIEAKLKSLPAESFSVTHTRLLLINLLQNSLDAQTNRKDRKFYGFDLVWNLILDTSPLDFEICEEMVREISRAISFTPPLREQFVKLAIENLANHTSALISLIFLCRLCDTFPKKEKRNERTTAAVDQLNKEYKLIELFFKDLLFWKEKAKEQAKPITDKASIATMVVAGTKNGYLYGLDRRLNLMSELFISCKEIKFDKTCADLLWEHLVNDPVSPRDREQVFEVLIHMGTQATYEIQPLPAEITDYLFEDRFHQFNVTDLSSKEYCFFDYFFRYLNWKKTSMTESEGQFCVSSFDISGWEDLWRIAFEATPEDTGRSAMTLLLRVQKGVDSSKVREQGPKFRAESVERCLVKYAKAVKALLDHKPDEMTDATETAANLLAISRATCILKDLMSQFDSRSKSQFRHDKRILGRPLEIKIQQVGAQNGAAAKLPLQVFTNESISSVRVRIAAKLGLPEECKLIANGQQLKDDGTVASYGIAPGSVVSALKSVGKSTAMAVDSAQDPLAITSILSQPDNFACIFKLLSLGGETAQQVWELVSMLPTSTAFLKVFDSLASQIPEQPFAWAEIFPESATFTLLYNLIIARSFTEKLATTESLEKWKASFVASGGVDHLLTVLINNRGFYTSSVQNAPRVREALSHLMSILTTLLVSAKSLINVDMLKGNFIMPLLKKLLEVAFAVSTHPLGDSDGEIIQDSMKLFVSCLSTYETLFSELVKTAQGCESFEKWLHRLLLDTGDAGVRKAIGDGMTHLCEKNPAMRPFFLASLFKFLASTLTTVPGLQTCTNFFDLLNALLAESLKALPEAEIADQLQKLVAMIASHPIIETRDGVPEDFVLQGLLATTRTILALAPNLKPALGSSGFLERVYHECLFDIATVDNHGPFAPPKCKTHNSRQKAFELLAELSAGCPANFSRLVPLLLEQNMHGEQKRIPWNYLPDNAQKSQTGYVGLRNLGATCYMNSVLQQLFMHPVFRFGILSAPLPKPAEGATTTILEQLQRVFGFMQESEKRSIDPTCLTKSICFGGEPLNPSIQMDAEEFLGNLFDALENQLKGTKYEKLIHECFAGTVCHQIISKGGCGHLSEKEEGYYTLQLVVQGKKTLEESLQEYIQGELLAGENQYFCEGCNGRVDALKRACLKRLPQTLFVHCKRFEYDLESMRRFKVNDEYSFPNRFNIERFTKQGLDKAEGSKQASPAPDQSLGEYELAGVVVHHGTADSGHYYSFIRERDGSTGKSGNGKADPKAKWMQFNDQLVEAFDVESQLRPCCFGGYETAKQWDNVSGSYQMKTSQRYYNAYMLVYDRVDASAELTKSFPVNPSDIVPRSIFHEVWEENMRFLHDKNVFDEDYQQFVWHGLINLSGPKESWTKEHAELAFRFLFDTLARAKDHGSLTADAADLKAVLAQNSLVAAWFLEHCANDLRWVKQLLLECPLDDVRSVAADLFTEAFNSVHKVSDPNAIFEYTPVEPSPEEAVSIQADSDIPPAKKQKAIEEKQSPFSFPSPGPSKSVLGRFADALLEPLRKDCTYAWRNFGRYFQVINAFVHVSPQHARYMVDRHLIALLIDLVLADDSPYAKLSSRRCKMEDKVSTADLSHAVLCTCFLLTIPDISEYLSEIDVQMASEVQFFTKCLKGRVCVPQICDILTRLAETEMEDPDRPERVMKQICKGIEYASANEMDGFFVVATNILAQDNDMQEVRCNRVVKTCIKTVKESEKYPKASYMLLRSLGELAQKNKCVREQIWEHGDTFANECLISFVTDYVREMAAEVLAICAGLPVTLSPIPDTIQSYLTPTASAASSAPATPQATTAEDPPLVDTKKAATPPLSPEEEVAQAEKAKHARTRLLELLLPLLPHASREYEGEDKNSSWKAVPYLKLVCRCIRDKEQQDLWRAHAENWIEFLMAMNSLHLSSNENTQELLRGISLAVENHPDNLAFLLAHEDFKRDFLAWHMNVGGEDHVLRLYNMAALPTYYKLLRKLCYADREGWLRKLASHNTFFWAVDWVVTASPSCRAASDLVVEILSAAIDADYVPADLYNTRLIARAISPDVFSVAWNSLDPEQVSSLVRTIIRTPAQALLFVGEGKTFKNLFKAIEAHLENDRTACCIPVLRAIKHTLDILLAKSFPDHLLPRRNIALQMFERQIALKALLSFMVEPGIEEKDAKLALDVIHALSISKEFHITTAELLANMFISTYSPAISGKPFSTTLPIQMAVGADYSKSDALYPLAMELLDYWAANAAQLDSGAFFRLGILLFGEKPNEETIGILLKELEDHNEVPKAAIARTELLLLQSVTISPHLYDGENANLFFQEAFGIAQTIITSKLMTEIAKGAATNALEAIKAVQLDANVGLKPALWALRALCAATTSPEIRKLITESYGSEIAKACVALKQLIGKGTAEFEEPLSVLSKLFKQ